MTLSIPRTLAQKTRDHLIQDDGQERFAYLYCNPSGDDLLVSRVDPVPDEDLGRQGRARVRPRPEVERQQVSECFDNDRHVLLLHSHPFSRIPDFSSLDRDLMPDLAAWIHGLTPETHICFGVIGKRGLETAAYTPENRRFERIPTKVIGDWKLEKPLQTRPEGKDTEISEERYDRNIRALTQEGQEKISTTNVAVVGTGSLGSILGEELARLGVENLTLIDPDTVEESNLPRLFGATEHHIGRPKVEALKNHLWRANPEIEITAIQSRAEDAEKALKKCDVLMGAVDQVSARSFLNEFAVKHLKYYIDAGSVIQTDGGRIESMQGFIQLVAPGGNGCFDCLDRGDPEAERLESLSEEELEQEVERSYIEETELAPEPAVVHLNGTMASLAASTFSKLVAGYEEPPDFLRYEELGNDLIAINTKRNPECITCGEKGVLGRGDREVTEQEIDPEDRELDLGLKLQDETTVEEGPVEPLMESSESKSGPDPGTAEKHPPTIQRGMELEAILNNLKTSASPAIEKLQTTGKELLNRSRRRLKPLNEKLRRKARGYRERLSRIPETLREVLKCLR